jgi:deoxyadenosine/deoxycytidine kinase
MPDVEVVTEPVGEWMTLKNEKGQSLLELFYEDKRRWAYTFQNCAILTRLRSLKNVLATTKKRVVITERSVLTDRYVFAELLRKSGDIDELEWQLYVNWYDTFAASLPLGGIIYLNTDFATSAVRIAKRGREGEEKIPAPYLIDLHYQHEAWIASSSLPHLAVSTADGVNVSETVAAIRTFVDRLLI